MQYIVRRPHQGDEWYSEGDTREAQARDVAHLVNRGILEKMEPAPLNKSAYVGETKTAPLADGPTGQAKPAQSSPAGQAQKKQASKKSKGAAKQ